jgi:hydrogenase nickel incorporation protein HypA/HybF
MHELSLVAELFVLLEEKAREEKASRINRISLSLGRLSGVVPELLASAFDSYKKGTLASEAELRIDVVPLKVRCRACGKETPTDEPLFACPTCASADLEILEGRDLILDRVELEV